MKRQEIVHQTENSRIKGLEAGRRLLWILDDKAHIQGAGGEQEEAATGYT